MSIVYKDFACGLEELNWTTPSPNTVLEKTGRAYLANGHPYFDIVHFKPVCEPWYAHETLQENFLQQTQKHGGVYAGAAGKVNLSYIATSRAAGAILFDINPFQKMFWDRFIEQLATHDNIDDFVEAMQGFAISFYEALHEAYDIKALRETFWRLGEMSDLYKGTPEYLHGKDPKYIEEVMRHNMLRQYSPFLHFTYSDFAQCFKIAADTPDSGYSYTKNRDLEWLQQPHLYRHMHELAKNNAMGALTLDILDTESCKQLGQFLNGAQYTPINYVSGTEEAPQTGATINDLYLSNIGHYLQWTDDEVQNMEDGNAIDFCKRDISLSAWETAINNLRPLVAKNARILRFDRFVQTGLGERFYPAFKIDKDNGIQIPGPLDPGGLVVDTL